MKCKKKNQYVHKFHIDLLRRDSELLEANWNQMISLSVSGMDRVTDRSKKAFEPSMKILSRISKIMLESGLIAKLSLSEKGRINYHRLNKHLDWMAKKHLVEAILEDGKMKLRLTQKGREFAATLSK